MNAPGPRNLLIKNARGLALAVVAGLILFSNLCGYLGIDYGVHWDEHYQIEGVRACIDNLILLPQKYIYGTVYFLSGIAVVLAHSRWFPLAFAREMSTRANQDIINLASYPSVQRFQRESHALIDSPRYLIENRMIFFALSSLVILWVYLLVRRLHPGRYAAALAAAAFVAGSWELQYHARFLAVDAAMAQVLTCQLLLLAAAWLARTPGWRMTWYLGSAFAAGMALTCKATGVSAFFPVALLPFLLPEQTDMRRRIGLAALGSVVAGVTAMLMQPGLFIDPLRVITVMTRESWEYGRIASDHPNLTSGIVDRLGSFLAWLWLAVPSPFVAVAVIASLIALLGLVVFVGAYRRLAILGAALFAPLLLAMITHPLMIVRQYLVFVPVLAVGFGNGIAWLQDRLRPEPWVWRVGMAALALVFLVQEHWLYGAAISIRDSNATTIADRAAADLLKAPEAIRLSANAYRELAPRLAPRFRCTPAAAAGRNLPVAIHVNEHAWRSNSFGLSRRFYGQRDVNYDWYSSWIGHPEHSPLMIVSPRNARFQHLATAGVCEPLSH